MYHVISLWMDWHLEVELRADKTNIGSTWFVMNYKSLDWTRELQRTIFTFLIVYELLSAQLTIVCSAGEAVTIVCSAGEAVSVWRQRVVQAEVELYTIMRSFYNCLMRLG